MLQRSPNLQVQGNDPRVGVIATAVSTRPSAPATPASTANVLSIIPFAIANGIQFAKIKPVTFSGPDQRGIVATYPINSNECVCSVPAKSAIRTYPGCKPALQIPQSAWESLPWFAQIALRILDEAKQGTESKFADYISVLPRQVDVPVLWSEHELQQLKCNYFIDQVQEQQREWSQLADKLQQYLSAAGISRVQFLWALSLTRSRAFAAPYAPAPLSTAPKIALAAQAAAAAAYLAAGAGAAAGVEVLGLSAATGLWYLLTQQSQTQQQHALCPLLDMFNHSGDEQSECELDIWSDTFRIVASRPWSAGQQVFISYGCSSNDVLLQLYGFVEADNSRERYLVRCLPEVLARQGMSGGSSIQKQALAEVAFTLQGISAPAAAALEQACSGRSNSSSTNTSDIVAYSQLSPLARSTCATALQSEIQHLNVDTTADEQVLQAYEQIPIKQQELLDLQQVVLTRESELQQLQQQLEKAQPTVAHQPHQQAYDQHEQGGEHAADDDRRRDGDVDVAEDTEPLLQLATLVDEKAEGLKDLKHDVSQLQQQVSEWRGWTLDCKELAVRYRVEKRKLLDACLLALM